VDTITLGINLRPPITAHNGGLFISRGKGTHPTRVIDSYELIVVRRGRLDLFENQRTFTLGAGDCLVLWPGRRHGGSAPYPLDLEFFWFHFQTDLRATASRAGLTVQQQTRLVRPERLYEMCMRFLDEQAEGTASATVRSVLLTLMLAELARTPPPAAAGSEAARRLAEQARERIVTVALDGQTTTARIAAQLSCNPDYLGRVFRQQVGHSITEEIHRVRIKMARRLLLESRLNVKEIAQECGFADTAFFRKVFRRLTGTRPLAFRHLHSRLHVNTE
jgi:AraC-like DNA-binding protein